MGLVHLGGFEFWWYLGSFQMYLIFESQIIWKMLSVWISAKCSKLYDFFSTWQRHSPHASPVIRFGIRNEWRKWALIRIFWRERPGEDFAIFCRIYQEWSELRNILSKYPHLNIPRGSRAHKYCQDTRPAFSSQKNWKPKKETSLTSPKIIACEMFNASLKYK